MTLRLRSRSQILVLVAGTIWSITTGASYLPGVTEVELPAGIRLFLQGAPISLNTYAVAWLITGAATLAALFTRRLILAATLIFIGMCTLNTIIYTGSWVQAIYQGDPSREWVTAGKYAAGCIVGIALTPRRKRFGVPRTKLRRAG